MESKVWEIKRYVRYYKKDIERKNYMSYLNPDLNKPIIKIIMRQLGKVETY